MDKPRRSREGDWLANHLDAPLGAVLAIPALFFPVLGLIAGVAFALVRGTRSAHAHENRRGPSLGQRLGLKEQNRGSATFLFVPFRLVSWLVEHAARWATSIGMGVLIAGISLVIAVLASGLVMLAFVGITHVWPGVLADMGTVRQGEDVWFVHLWARLAGYFMLWGSASVLTSDRKDRLANTAEGSLILAWAVLTCTAIAFFLASPIISFFPADKSHFWSVTMEEMPEAFIGTWKGTVHQKNVGKSGQPTYPVVITLYSGSVGNPTGRSSYVTLKCGGSLFAGRFERDRVLVVERITFGRDKCTNSVPITLTLNNTQELAYDFGDGLGTAVLHR